MDQNSPDPDSSVWPGFRLLVGRELLARFAEQPPNSEAHWQFVDVHPLLDADGRQLGVIAVTGQSETQGQVVCVVRWNPAVATEMDARAALERLIGD